MKRKNERMTEAKAPQKMRQITKKQKRTCTETTRDNRRAQGYQQE